MNQTTEAIKQYRVALTRAYERDDAAAIGDVGYNLAVAQLRAGSAGDAMRTVREFAPSWTAGASHRPPN